MTMFLKKKIVRRKTPLPRKMVPLKKVLPTSQKKLLGKVFPSGR